MTDSIMIARGKYDWDARSNGGNVERIKEKTLPIVGIKGKLDGIANMK
jgi:hypothetical protein